MFGTRPEIERFHAVSSAARSYKFAEKLSGRFFVSGVSGSFKKFDSEKLQEKRVDDEFMKESERLHQLELKLMNIQRLKELQHNRDESRQLRKKQHKAASLIQRIYRPHILATRQHAVAVITDFLKAGLAKQGVSAGLWATAVLKRFFRKITRANREMAIKKRIKRFAEAQVDTFKDLAIKSAQRYLILPRETPMMLTTSPKSNYGFRGPPNLRPAQSLGDRTEDPDSTFLTGINIDYLHEKPKPRIVPSVHVPFLPNPKESPHDQASPEASIEAKEAPAKQIYLEAEENIEPENISLDRVKILHQQYCLFLEKEKQQRLRNIELRRIRSQEEVRLQKEQQAMKALEKEKYRDQYLSKLEADRLMEARQKAKLRAEKDRASMQAMQEESMRAKEVSLMRKEDFRSRELRALFKAPRKIVITTPAAETTVAPPAKSKLSIEELEERRKAIIARVAARQRQKAQELQQAQRVKEETKELVKKVVSEASKVIKKCQPTMKSPRVIEASNSNTVTSVVRALREFQTQHASTPALEAERAVIPDALPSKEDYCNIGTVDDKDDKQAAFPISCDNEIYEKEETLTSRIREPNKIHSKRKQRKTSGSSNKLPKAFKDSPYARANVSFKELPEKDKHQLLPIYNDVPPQSSKLVSELQDIINKARILNGNSDLPNDQLKIATTEKLVVSAKVADEVHGVVPKSPVVFIAGGLHTFERLLGPAPSLDIPRIAKQATSKDTTAISANINLPKIKDNESASRSRKARKTLGDIKVINVAPEARSHQAAKIPAVQPTQELLSRNISAEKSCYQKDGTNPVELTSQANNIYVSNEHEMTNDLTQDYDSEYGDEEFDEEADDIPDDISLEYNFAPTFENYVPPASMQRMQEEKVANHSNVDEFAQSLFTGAVDDMLRNFIGDGKARKSKPQKGINAQSLQLYEAQLQQEAAELRQSLLSKISSLDEYG